MNLENLDDLMDRYTLLLKIKYNNNHAENQYLDDEIFNIRQRLLVQQADENIIKALEDRYKI